MTKAVPTRKTRTGASLPMLGQGTWELGLDPSRRRDEVQALQLGIDLGLTLIDTAEMYAEGGAEEVVGEAIRGRRDQVFLVSKVLPENASRRGTVAAAERSLRRLGTDHIDLYLLHWAGDHPPEETLAAFHELEEDGKILHFGVSNFELARMQATEKLPYGSGVAANQVLYNLARRGIEWDLLPWCHERGVLIMSYSPLEQGRLVIRPSLAEAARAHGATPQQIAIAWTLRKEGIVTVVKASTPEHVRANAAAASIQLTEPELTALNRDYPPPAGPGPLETL